MANGHKTGVLLVNLGTPDAPRTPEVRRYLREFLMDGRVIDVPAPVRWALVNLIIGPFRAPKSAKAYQKVWTDEGSPLLVHGERLQAMVDELLPEWPVVLAMRYGTPSIPAGLAQLEAQGCDHIVVCPLYPQYASSTTGSIVEAVYREVQERWNTPFISIVPPFYAHPSFVEAFEAVGRPVLDEVEPDHVLFSFHGVPERHMHKSDPTGQHCLKVDECCERAIESRGELGQQCYRAQCVVSARLIARKLGLAPSQFSVSFQSRLGRQEWLKPYTDKRVEELAKAGVKRLAVFCPAFVADCLETIEEIGMEAAEDFEHHGGEIFALVPSLNSSPRWAEAVAELVRATAVPRVRLPIAAADEASASP